MSTLNLRRSGLLAALGFCLAPVVISLADPPSKPMKNEFYKGKVVPLADLVEKSGGKLDSDAAPFWLVLSADNGKIYPLVKDDGARMFFKDATLLNRPMRLTGRLLPGSELLQVVEVHSYAKDTLQEMYYWC